MQTTDNKDPLISYNYADMSIEDFSKMMNEAYFNEYAEYYFKDDINYVEIFNLFLED